MGKRLLIICLVLALLLPQFITGCSIKSGKKFGSLSSGKEVNAAAVSITPQGGIITISQADSPLNGMVMNIPENAYPDTRQFNISYAPVTKHNFGADFNPISPLISVDNGDTYAEDVITMQIPVEIPENQFAMAFYYDDTEGTLEGIPLADASANSITIATRHFSDVVVSSIDISKLGADAEVATGFEPGTDDWQFTNYGSYIAPGGHCAGQSITALWYYSQMKSAGEHSLYEYYNEGTRDFWYDDAKGYRLASVIQEDVDWNAWEARYNKLKPKAQADNSMVWKQFVYSMMVTGEPQFVYIQNTTAGGAHAMIAYGVSGGVIQIADPNYPGSNDREIWYDDGELEPYQSGANAQDILDGKGTAYDLVLYFGASSLIDWDAVSNRWSELEDGTIGNDRFPGYIIQTNNDEGKLVELSDGYTTPDKKINIYVSSDNALVGCYVFRDGEQLFPATEGTNEFGLKPGNNQMGIYVVGKTGDDYEYIDFQYINVKCDQPTSSTVASGGRPVITAFDGPSTLQFDSGFNVVGQYTFSVSVEGGSPPYYFIWKGARAPQILAEGENTSSITINPQDMRQPGAISDGFFLWVTVRDSKKQHAVWGNGSTEFLYGLKFTGRFEVVDGVTTLVDNTWEIVREP